MLIVSDINYGNSALILPIEKRIQQQRFQRLVKCGEWLIEQQQLWLADRVRARATRCCSPPETAAGRFAANGAI